MPSNMFAQYTYRYISQIIIRLGELCVIVLQIQNDSAQKSPEFGETGQRARAARRGIQVFIVQLKDISMSRLGHLLQVTYPILDIRWDTCVVNKDWVKIRY